MGDFRWSNYFKHVSILSYLISSSINSGALHQKLLYKTFSYPEVRPFTFLHILRISPFLGSQEGSRPSIKERILFSPQCRLLGFSKLQGTENNKLRHKNLTFKRTPVSKWATLGLLKLSQIKKIHLRQRLNLENFILKFPEVLSDEDGNTYTLQKLSDINGTENLHGSS